MQYMYRPWRWVTSVARLLTLYLFFFIVCSFSVLYFFPCIATAASTGTRRSELVRQSLGDSCDCSVAGRSLYVWSNQRIRAVDVATVKSCDSPVASQSHTSLVIRGSSFGGYSSYLRFFLYFGLFNFTIRFNYYYCFFSFVFSYILLFNFQFYFTLTPC